MTTVCRPIPQMSPTKVAHFWAKVDVRGLDGPWCWEWEASCHPAGYGQVNVGGQPYPSHRVAYTLSFGEIPYGLVLDHLCRNRACCNPWHLEPVTLEENTSRGEQSMRTHCPQGHPYSGQNLYTRKSGKRECRACARYRARVRKAAERRR